MTLISIAGSLPMASGLHPSHARGGKLSSVLTSKNLQFSWGGRTDAHGTRCASEPHRKGQFPAPGYTSKKHNSDYAFPLKMLHCVLYHLRKNSRLLSNVLQSLPNWAPVRVGFFVVVVLQMLSTTPEVVSLLFVGLESPFPRSSHGCSISP